MVSAKKRWKSPTDRQTDRPKSLTNNTSSRLLHDGQNPDVKSRNPSAAMDKASRMNTLDNDGGVCSIIKMLCILIGFWLSRTPAATAVHYKPRVYNT